MELKELSEILLYAVTNAASQPGANRSLQTGLLSKSAAYRRYGRSNVDRWLKEGLLKTSHKKIYRTSIEAVAASSNRNSYLPVAERN